MDSPKDENVDQNMERIKRNLPDLTIFRLLNNNSSDPIQDDSAKERKGVDKSVDDGEEAIGEPRTSSRLPSSSPEINSSEFELDDSDLETSYTSSEPSSLPGLVAQSELPDPDPSMLCIIVSKGVPETLARFALRVTRNRSVAEAIHWINNINDDEEEEDGMNLDDIVMVLIVNSSLSMSSGRMYVESARAVARLSLRVKDEVGLEMLELVDQGTSEVRLAQDKRHMEDIMETVEMSRMEAASNCLMASFSRDVEAGVGEEASERYVMAIFGEAADVEELVGSLSLMIN